MPLILLDFDGTITQSDSINSLVHSAITNSPTLSHDPGAASQAWAFIVNAWLADLEAHVAAYSPPAESRTTAEEELVYLESLEALEKASVARVEKAGLFAGLTEKKLEELGKEVVAKGEVRLRKGFEELMKEIGQRGLGVGVVSVNWSEGWVRGAVGTEVEGVVNSIGEDGRLKGPDVEGFGRDRMMLTAGDKVEAARGLVKRNGGGKWMYVGDSTTDLGCLLEADVGVVMGDRESSKLLQMLGRVGFEVPRVEERMEAQGLVWARDFEEVLRCGVLDWLRD
ncbi:HAD-like domain-containing protein [Podospora aff. communis PSN243]|uniref:HAD-like domain-containing protein n=1 Tax=Podospora aff. communis PSN243 TaxID=3040156 RepID=A0AAV9GTY4_9PEZI|nr:HAD-like domain-containing protein [Podospora aff. communis PSN243]